MSGHNTEMEGKRVEILRDLLPDITKFAGLFNMSNPVASPQREALINASKILHLQARLLDVRKSEDIASAFDAAVFGYSQPVPRAKPPARAPRSCLSEIRKGSARQAGSGWPVSGSDASR
jgi:hypothetical protein